MAGLCAVKFDNSINFQIKAKHTVSVRVIVCFSLTFHTELSSKNGRSVGVQRCLAFLRKINLPQNKDNALFLTYRISVNCSVDPIFMMST